jgi:hypothetical protein
MIAAAVVALVLACVAVIAGSYITSSRMDTTATASGSATTGRSPNTLQDQTARLPGAPASQDTNTLQNTDVPPARSPGR